ncbi:MAG TPA: DUF4160 domain-containing protein [Gemmatimonadaceae bacterium]|nr:DUF4160 domain-containing protein [Gemmatimonadaceae bacterium]
MMAESQEFGATMAVMPEISRFLGIVISMPYSDHEPPHFHARYGDHKISVGILDGRVTGQFPPRARALVLEWRAQHEAELLENWNRARGRRPLMPITPLE